MIPLLPGPRAMERWLRVVRREIAEERSLRVQVFWFRVASRYILLRVLECGAF